MRALALPVVSLSLLTSCGPNGEVPGLDDHPCKVENHCLREDGESVCEPGYDWEDPADEDNYNCVEIGAEAGRVDWTLPQGGHADRGFYALAGGGPEGSDNWSLMDMDGDRLADLVVTGQRAVDGNDYGFGFPNEPHWRVFKNTGSGFATEATRFRLPSGGHVDRGFYALAGGGPEGSDNWSLADMNGDGRPDLVLAGQRAADGNDYGFGYPNDPHWRVYVNDGAGFVR